MRLRSLSCTGSPGKLLGNKSAIFRLDPSSWCRIITEKQKHVFYNVLDYCFPNLADQRNLVYVLVDSKSAFKTYVYIIVSSNVLQKVIQLFLRLEHEVARYGVLRLLKWFLKALKRTFNSTVCSKCLCLPGLVCLWLLFVHVDNSFGYMSIVGQMKANQMFRNIDSLGGGGCI